MKSGKQVLGTTASPTPAAQYIRMSTEGQDLSPEIQRQALAEYADRNGMRIVASYEDPGRSGLTLRARHSMRRLIRDVVDDACPFDVILVYDVSRWGRFIDADASAYYEYHCRLHGVQVVYVNEPFAPEPTPMGALLKNLKRAMAAEYSRELGVKCRAGQSRSIALGYQMGSLPVLGFRRMAVSAEGTMKRLLEPGERKPSPTDRVRWVAGPDDEIELVRTIFRLYATTKLSMQKIADILNGEGHLTCRGKPFTEASLGVLFGCEAFIGNFVWGRRDERRGLRRPASDPTISRGLACVPPIVDPKTWELVRRKRQNPSLCRASNAEMLHSLRAALRRQPRLRETDLKAMGCPSGSTYRNHFGSFLAAAELALGDRRGKYSEVRRRMASTWRLIERFIADLLELLRAHGVHAARPTHQCAILLEGRTRIVVQVLWRSGCATLQPRWIIKKRDCGDCQYVLFLRMLDVQSAEDFVLLTINEYQRSRWRCELTPQAGIRLRTAEELLRALRCTTLRDGDSVRADVPSLRQ